MKVLAVLIPAFVTVMFVAFDQRHGREDVAAPVAAISPSEATQTAAAPQSSPPHTLTPFLSGRADVVDGDTIDVSGTRVRLFGIDAPEKSQVCERDGLHWPCGREAMAALAHIAGDHEVRCEPRGSDRSNRLIARCWVGTTDLSRWMVGAGWALAYRRFTADYSDAEDAARGGRRGLWSGTFETPEDWRRQRRGAAN